MPAPARDRAPKVQVTDQRDRIDHARRQSLIDSGRERVIAEQTRSVRGIEGSRDPPSGTAAINHQPILSRTEPGVHLPTPGSDREAVGRLMRTGLLRGE